MNAATPLVVLAIRFEHALAAQKTHMNLFIRTIGLARATVKIGMANVTHNVRRLVGIHARTAFA